MNVRAHVFGPYATINARMERTAGLPGTQCLQVLNRFIGAQSTGSGTGGRRVAVLIPNRVHQIRPALLETISAAGRIRVNLISAWSDEHFIHDEADALHVRKPDFNRASVRR